jgi:hypothetical protein
MRGVAESAWRLGVWWWGGGQCRCTSFREFCPLEVGNLRTEADEVACDAVRGYRVIYLLGRAVQKCAHQCT